MRCFIYLFFLLSYIIGNSYYLLANPVGESGKPGKSKKKTENLVRVGVMNFIDKQGAEDYAWLSGGLAQAIGKSFRTKFNYQKTSSEANERALLRILKEEGKEKKNLTLTDIQELSKRQNLDVVIYGHFYGLHEKGAKISTVFIQPKLYLAFFEKAISLDEATNPLDSSVFDVTDKVSSIVVEEIGRLTDLQHTLPLTVLVPQVVSQDASNTRDTREAEDPKKLLDGELKRLKKYLKDKFQGDILTLTEYLNRTPKSSPPRNMRQKTLSDWKRHNSIKNLVKVIVKIKGNQVEVSLSSGKGVQTKVVYPSASSGKSGEEINQEIDKAYSKIGSVLKDSAVSKLSLYKENFDLGWGLVYLEFGLAAGSGLTFLSNASPLTIQARAFLRLSPGALTENHNIGFLNDFTHPVLRPLVFNFAFGFGHTLSVHKQGLDDGADGLWSHDFSLNVYSLSLGASYSHIFFKRMRILAGLGFSYYFSDATSSFVKNEIQTGVNPNQNVRELIYAPALFVSTNFQYLLLSYLGLGAGIHYTHYFGNTSESSPNVSQISLFLEVAYVL